ncbi:MAG: hypothetical protein R6V12_14060, partial [Candidatus Hydrogenedentota bacterium]
VKYGVPWAFGVEEPSFAVYTGAELAVSFAVFYLDGLLSKVGPEKQREIDALFDELEGRTEE